MDFAPLHNFVSAVLVFRETEYILSLVFRVLLGEHLTCRVP